MSGTVKRKYEEVDGCDAPQCKFGKGCYRMNVEHFKKYQHSDGTVHKSSAECQELFGEGKSQDGTSPGTSGGTDSNPYSVYLNSVEGIESCFNESCLSIRDLLSDRFGNLIRSAQFNYCIDIPWLMSQYPPYNRTKPLLIIHGCKGEEKLDLDETASSFSNVRLCQANLDIPFGTHHTKMMLNLYEEGLKVIITTANLVEGDWTKKSQSIWVSPTFRTIDSESRDGGDSVTNFRRDLMLYLSSYKKRQLDEWVEVIRQHDFSETKVFLIPSVPGRFSTNADANFGHLKLRRILENECKNESMDASWPVLCQISSIGSLGDKPDAWLRGEFLSSLSGSKRDGPKQAKELMIVYPTCENIRGSLEGYMAGASFPYARKTAERQPYLKSLMWRWKFDSRGRSRAMPHLKSYFRTSPSHEEVAWYLLTSANLSKAAWGSLEKNRSQLFIRSYELGVLHLPELYNASTNLKIFKDFPVPLDLPPTRYMSDDRPWIVDMPYTDLADCKGRVWDPR